MDRNLDGALVAMEAELMVNLSINGILPLLEREAGGFMIKVEKMDVTSVNRENTPEMVSRMISILRKKGNDEFYSFLDILDKSGNNVWANKLRERVTLPSRQYSEHMRSAPTYSYQQVQPQQYPQQGPVNPYQGQQYPMRNEAHGQFPAHNDHFRSPEIPSHDQQNRMAYSSHLQGQGYQAGYSTPPPSHDLYGRRTSGPPQVREMSTEQPQHRSRSDPRQPAPSLPHEQTHVGRPPPPVDSSSRRQWLSNTSNEQQMFEGSRNMFNERSGQLIGISMDQETLPESVEEAGHREQGPRSSTGYQHPVVGSDLGSQPASIDLRYTSAVHDGPREEPFSNLPSQSGRVSWQEENLQPIGGHNSRSGPASQLNLTALSGDQMQPTVVQQGHSTVRNSASRNPPVPGTMSQAQLAPQQQRNSPQLAGPGQLFRLLPSGLSGTANEPLTKEQLARIILEAKRKLLQSSLERDFGQDGGQRCISFHDLVNFCRGVFRIEINYRERNSICRGSGFFVEVEKGHWIVTACHNLLSAADGDLMKDGKWTDIKVLVEGKWCKIKTLDQALQRDTLKVKMQENLLQAEFLLPDNEFVLRERQSLDQVIPDVGHLVFDPKDDILAIRCVDPKRLKLECGATATAFHLDPDVMQQYVPAVTHCLAIVHCPWGMPTPDGWRGPPPRDIVQYNHGMLSVIDGSAIRYDMVTYPGSSGSPVFFCGYNGIVLVGVHRKSHIDPWNQCSHLTAEFITNEMLK